MREILLFIIHNMLGYFCLSDDVAWLTFWNITTCFFLMQKYTPLTKYYSPFYSNLMHYLGYASVLMSCVAYKNCCSDNNISGPMSSGDEEIVISILLYYFVAIFIIICQLVKEKTTLSPYANHIFPSGDVKSFMRKKSHEKLNEKEQKIK